VRLADGKQPLVPQLTRLRAIGAKGAWVLIKEVFGWRRFANRRELAGCLGLAPTPCDSGDSQIEQGSSACVGGSRGCLRVACRSTRSAWR